MSLIADRPALPLRHRHGAAGPVRFNHYDAEHARALEPEITHLDAAAGQESDTASWLGEAADRPGFDLVTAALDGKLVGYLAAELGEHVRLTRTALVPRAVTAHPELPVVLVDAVLSHADRPWIDLVVPTGFPALQALLTEGWTVASSDETGTCLRLSGH